MHVNKTGTNTDDTHTGIQAKIQKTQDKTRARKDAHTTILHLVTFNNNIFEKTPVDAELRVSVSSCS